MTSADIRAGTSVFIDADASVTVEFRWAKFIVRQIQPPSSLDLATIPSTIRTW